MSSSRMHCPQNIHVFTNPQALQNLKLVFIFIFFVSFASLLLFVFKCESVFISLAFSIDIVAECRILDKEGFGFQNFED